jgi:hypothetical protein
MPRTNRRPAAPNLQWPGSIAALDEHKRYLAKQRATSSKKTLGAADLNATQMKPRCRSFLEWCERHQQQNLSIEWTLVQQRDRAPTIHARFKNASGNVVLNYWPATGTVQTKERIGWRVATHDAALEVARRAAGLAVDANVGATVEAEVDRELAAAGARQNISGPSD